ncbi:hypothetical protein K9M41_02125 [Candidatus Gracilibacteria bacterium]|nr:hypothetical protein [Candidatus Gracilibacteria bacterium]
MPTLQSIIKNASQEELIEIYVTIEPKVLPVLEAKVENEALDDLKKGNVFKASSAKEVMKKCLR